MKENEIRGAMESICESMSLIEYIQACENSRVKDAVSALKNHKDIDIDCLMEKLRSSCGFLGDEAIKTTETDKWQIEHMVMDMSRLCYRAYSLISYIQSRPDLSWSILQDDRELFKEMESRCGEMLLKIRKEKEQ